MPEIIIRSSMAIRAIIVARLSFFIGINSGKGSI